VLTPIQLIENVPTLRLENPEESSQPAINSSAALLPLHKQITRHSTAKN
jgi:hypothetical protein